MIFGVRPNSIPNESLYAYLLRLAWCNGLKSVKEILKAIGRADVVDKKWNNSEIIAISQALASWLNRPTEIIVKPFLHHSHAWMYSTDYAIPDLKVHFARVCPHCIKEKFIDWRSGLAMSVRCHRHNAMLIDCCPQCHSQLPWHYSIYEGCHSCGFRWASLDHSKETIIAPSSELEARLYANDQGEIDATPTEIASFTHAVCAIARPFDVQSEFLQVIPYSFNHSQLALQAIQLVQMKCLPASWCIRMKELSPEFSDSILKRRIKKIQKHTNLDDVITEHELDFLPVERFGYLSKRRQKLANTYGVDSARTHVSHVELAELVGLRREDLLPLINLNLLKSIYSTNILRDKIFNYIDFIQLIRAKTSHNIPEDWLQINRYTNSLRVNLCEYGDVLKAVLSDELRGVFSSADQIDHCYVEPHCFSDFLQQHLEMACKEPLSKARVANALGVPTVQVEDLVKKGKLRWALWLRGNTKIDGASYLMLCANS
jgi:hypothetical protein